MSEIATQNDIQIEFRRKLLGFGYIRDNYDQQVPADIVLLITEFYKLCLESNILSEEEQEYLINLVEQQPQTQQFKYGEWNLLCSGKRDGIKQKIFHDRCDNKPNTICILDVTSTGYVCGGYASTKWKSVGGYARAKDDDAYLFVIRPKEARKVCHRKRDENGELLQPDAGILYCEDDGFNFGYNTLFWGNGESQPKSVYCDDDQDYFEYKSAKDIVGKDESGSNGEELECATFSDFEVFQLKTTLDTK